MDSGAILVAAAGNIKEGELERAGSCIRPYPGVIAVGAVDYNYGDTPNWHGTAWRWIDFVAPGGDKYVDSDGDGQRYGVQYDAQWSYGFMQEPPWQRLR